jgi:hypothetical protein
MKRVRTCALAQLSGPDISLPSCTFAQLSQSRLLPSVPNRGPSRKTSRAANAQKMSVWAAVAKQGCVGTSVRTCAFHGLASSPSLPSLPQARQSKHLLKPPLHNPDCPKDGLVFTCKRSGTTMAFEPLAARLRELGQSG